ncbi:MAG TPA: MarC family protein [Gemmatimonadaceae bacterium]|nr:MarC family protein [Gemmatimonadaceae bacterium]
MSLLSAAVLMFFVMDPLGNVPLFLAALRNVAPARQRRVIARELIVALLILVFFLFAGQYILDVLHVSATALRISGGVVLLLIALRMIFPTPDRPLREDVSGEPFIVPLAVPYTAGPSALATELLLVSREPERWPVWLGAVLIAWVATAAILYSATGVSRFLGERGLIAIERLMGMLLITVAVQMLLDGLGLALAR